VPRNPDHLAWIAIALLTVAFACPAYAQSSPADPKPAAVRVAQADEEDAGSASALAKKLQNPIGDLYSIPFQGNINLGYGPHKGAQEILNIQPVIPIHLNEDWNLITRTILPLIWQPSLQPAQTVPFGSGPTLFSAFLSPSKPVDGWVWGVGPIVQLPTASSSTLGSSVWGGGPTAVVVRMKGPWVYGGLVNNVWSFGGRPGRDGNRYNNFLLQPFVNYNFDAGWYVNTGPIITANWLAAGNHAWTLPVGFGGGRVIKIGGKLPVNLSMGVYYNALRPDYGARWQLRPQATLIF
jgi:hypothetical protein